MGAGERPRSDAHAPLRAGRLRGDPLHKLHYGLGAFEGIRCYKLHDGRSAIFRLDEHVRRLFDSAHICMLPMPYSQEQIVEACLETVRENGLDDYYLRPIAFMGLGEILLGARSNPTHVAVVAWRLGAYPGEGGSRRTRPRRRLAHHRVRRTLPGRAYSNAALDSVADGDSPNSCRYSTENRPSSVRPAERAARLTAPRCRLAWSSMPRALDILRFRK